MMKKVKSFEEMTIIESLSYMETIKKAKTLVIIAEDENGDLSNISVKGASSDIASAITTILNKLYHEKAFPEEFIDDLPRLIKSNKKELEKEAHKYTDKSKKDGKKELIEALTKLTEKLKSEEK